MAPVTSITIDVNEVTRKLASLDKEVQNKILPKALGQAGMQLLRDSVMRGPSVPFDEGTLQGSGSVFVAQDRVGTSEMMRAASPGAKPTPATVNNTPDGSDNRVAVIGFNTPYAASLHEHPEYNFQQKKGGEGGKYLETPLIERRNVYMKVVADVLGNLLK